MLLVGDIGGTKTTLALVADRGSDFMHQQTYPSARYDSLETLISDYLRDCGVKAGQLKRAVFGVAGPVINGRAKITNLTWVIEEKRLHDMLGITDVTLLNDLEAIAYSIPHLGEADLHTINPGQAAPNGTLAIIAPGTGLGQAFLTWAGDHYNAHATEGGHVDFAPISELQVGLLRHLQTRLGHVSVERVCSGLGIANIYTYLKQSNYAEEPAWLADVLADAKDITPIITQVALDKDRACAICDLTLEVFVSILGAQAGNLALTVFSHGGLYLGGGIPPKILPALADGTFMQAFRRKGRMADMLDHMPIHVVLNDQTPLLGSARYGQMQ